MVLLAPLLQDLAVSGKTVPGPAYAKGGAGKKDVERAVVITPLGNASMVASLQSERLNSTNMFPGLQILTTTG